MENVFYIGWDVGGMHGANNALSIIQIKKSKPQIVDLISFSKPKTAEDLAQEISNEILNKALKAKATLVAIDAPLSFPRKFVEQIQNLHFIKPLDFSTQIDNPLAYRESESYLFKKTKKRPLSSTFDQLTSLTILVQRVFQLIKDRGITLNIMPFHSAEVENGINAFECYPGNLKSGKMERKEQIAFWKYAEPYLNMAKSEHLKDAILCALFAAFEMEKPDSLKFKIEEDFRHKASIEGWIYGFY